MPNTEQNVRDLAELAARRRAREIELDPKCCPFCQSKILSFERPIKGKAWNVNNNCTYFALREMSCLACFEHFWV